MTSTVIYKGRDCVKSAPDAFKLGKSCIIITGRSSAKKCGAYSDVTEVLSSLGIEYTLYDKIGENPTIESCFEASAQARDFGAEFVIGIGGGSPLDACKAISTMAKMPELDRDTLFDASIEKKSLPIIAIPLTAGTGSEVDKNSVLTLGDKKKTYIDDSVFPIAAFLDPKYLKTLNANYTVATAIDAFCHCIESYVSPKATRESEGEALAGGKLIWDALTTNSFEPDENDAAGLDEETRLNMLVGAAYGGMALTVTGTGFTHPLGYGLSLYYGVPHGKACGAFTGKYIELNMTTEAGRERLTAFASHLGTTPEIIGAVITAMSDVNLILDEERSKEMISKVSGARNYTNSPFIMTDEIALEIYKELFA